MSSSEEMRATYRLTGRDEPVSPEMKATMNELTLLQKLQIDCSSAAQHYVEILDWYGSRSFFHEEDLLKMGDATNNLRQATKAVDAQMAKLAQGGGAHR